jgi:hypothetical protein
MSEDNRAAPARRLMRDERHGVLCTLSRRVAGWPFGSVAPYALDASGEPLILISEIAEHTRNLRADARASLFIQDSEARHDPQAGARLTLMGLAAPVAERELDDGRRRYLTRFPEATSFFEVHDFTLFKIRVEHVRFIGGFGEIYWLEPSEILVPDDAGDPLAPFAAEICEHMNADHADALILYCAVYAGIQTSSAEMIHVDARGFDVLTGQGARQKGVRIDFPRPVSTPNEVRQVMIEMLKQARERAGGGATR